MIMNNFIPESPKIKYLIPKVKPSFFFDRRSFISFFTSCENDISPIARQRARCLIVSFSISLCSILMPYSAAEERPL